MEFFDLVLSSFRSIGGLVAVMIALAALEGLVPLRERGLWHRAHLGPNLALTGITFATNAVLNAALVLALASLEASGYRPLQRVGLGTLGSTFAVVVVLDLTWYAAHRSMHRVSWLWRVHSVHHSDPVVDVTTTIRQHPAEGLVRYAYMGAAALAMGAGPAAFAVYRIWSALHGLATHANVRLPARVDAMLAAVFVTPSLHRLHHARERAETDSNYATIFSFFDRGLGTLTAPRRGVDVAFGLDGYDEPARQTTSALLRAPWGDPAAPRIASTLAVLVALVAAQSGCAAAVHRDGVPGCGLAAARSYAWLIDEPGLLALGRAQPDPHRVVGEAQLRDAIAAALGRRGLVPVDRAHAELIAAFRVDTRTRYRLEGGSGGPFEISGPSKKHTLWTLHLFLLDGMRRRQQLHAWTSAWLTDARVDQGAIEAAVARLMSACPRAQQHVVRDLRKATR